MNGLGSDNNISRSKVEGWVGVIRKLRVGAAREKVHHLPRQDLRDRSGEVSEVHYCNREFVLKHLILKTEI